ncbi:MAG: phage tail protein [Phaeodactylibacter sp.]|nr:phage tail protein [Phaeodactylibacter sp.]MCB9301671.1 phage tail protein [Lewinellaceae bacterium]
MPTEYPPVSFHFRVRFTGKSELAGEIQFQSVSGLNVELQTETIKEGGENRFEHVVPVRSKYSDLILKRGVVKDSKVIAWCRKAIESLAIEPITLKVDLLNEEHNELVSWTVYHAWPKKWSVSDLNAEQSAILIETLELNYNYFEVNHSPSG